MSNLAALLWAKFQAQDKGFHGMADAFEEMIKKDLSQQWHLMQKPIKQIKREGK